MKPNEFAHLHLHTDASFIDGLGTVERTVTHAKSLGFEALGITEHGNLTNTLSFIETCIQNGIKPISGLEGYVSVDNERFHITLLADGNTGFNSLVKLNNIGFENYDGRPTFSISDLIEYNEGLIVLTGCPESPLQKNDVKESERLFTYLKKTYGERLLVEMMLVNYGTPYERSIHLSETFKTDIILTNDVHFAKKTDKQSHLKLLKMKAGGFSYNSEHLYLTTPQELIDRAVIEFNRKDILPYVERGIKNAGNLSKKLGVVQFNNKPKLPHIPNADKKLWQLITEGYENKVKQGILEDSAVYVDRYTREYNVIKEMDFSSYFLILHDVINYSHKNNIWVGKGRGSGAGSLVLYLTGITDVDPIKYGLLFERFLNYKRADMPDVDVDFDAELRDNVLEYASKKWNATPVATYSTYKHKSALVDLKKQFDLPKNLLKEASDFGEESAQFKQLKDNNKEFADMYDAIHNQIRHVGKHAGGVVINESNFPLPLIRVSNGKLVSAWTEGLESRELSKVGLVKFDFLGLASGSVLRRLKTKLNVEVPEPTDNHEVFTIFQTGNTNGIFQFGGSDGIIQFCKSVKPVCIDDLVAINALFRPGPLDSGAAFEYPQLKKDGKQRSLHKDIDHFLTNTYGVITFQEQVMQIIGFLMDGDLADADLARKVISKANPNNKEWVKKFNQLKDEFFEGAKNHGWSSSDTKKVWGEIETHSGYSFNKSHSVAYALLAWELAWFKYYYPLHFYTELLNVEKDDIEKVESYMYEAVITGVNVKNPDINKSTNEYTCDETTNSIYLPITSVKYVSEKTYLHIKSNRPFSTVEDFMLRVPKSQVKSKAREGLLALGAFDNVNSSSDKHKILDVEEVTNLTKLQIQDNYLGFTLPTKKFIEQKTKAESMGYIVGMVSEVEKRNKGYGDYFVVRMKPEGNFWYTQKGFIVKPVEGMMLAVKKSDKGQATEIHQVEF